jgi:hypothetical protein
MILDIQSDTAEVVFFEDHLPRFWHAFDVAESNGALVHAHATGIQTAVNFYRRQNRDTTIGGETPVIVVGERPLDPEEIEALSEAIDHPVANAERPSPVVADIPVPAFLTCLGLLMRRS